MPVGERPILEIVVGQLRDAGFTRLTFAVGYLASLIQAYFNDGSRFGVAIDYSLEGLPLGTAGPLSLIDRPDEDFLVMNGDILTDLDYSRLMEQHKASDAVATLAVFQKEVPISLGVLELDDAGAVTRYIEKPSLRYPVSTGVYCFRPMVLDVLKRNARLDLPDLIRTLIASGVSVQAYEFEGHWLDIGRPEDYEAAIALLGTDDSIRE
jgi:NDP-sugar pyrophosphorylase family protein